MNFRVFGELAGKKAQEQRGFFRKKPLVSKAFRKRLKEDITAYKMNMEALAGPDELGLDCIPGKTHFGRALKVFSQAVAAYTHGHRKFKAFKFSEEFKKELVEFIGKEKGSKLFDAWAQDASVEIEGTLLRETSAFEDALTGGRVNGKPNCQEPTLRMFHVGGITGTIELPWVKQIVIGDAEKGFDYRRRLFLMRGHDGAPILLMQPAYFRDDLPHAKEIEEDAEKILRDKYEPLGVEVRLMPPVMLSYDVGSNTGYGTFTSGRAPMFYIDSNCHTWELGGEVIGRNGLHPREEGESIDFSEGWSSNYQLGYGKIN